MYVADDEGVHRLERVFYGDPLSRKELPFDARARMQVLGGFLLITLGLSGYKLVSAALFMASPMLRVFVSVALGAGAGMILAVMLTRAVGRIDKPHTRWRYWVCQVRHLASAPKPPPPPIDVVHERPTTNEARHREVVVRAPKALRRGQR